MEIFKQSEKIIIWMHRNKVTGQQIANEIGITRQAWSNKLQSNYFTQRDIATIKRMGYAFD